MPRKTPTPRWRIWKLREIDAHIGIAPNHDALRELLGAPADLPLVQWRIGPLDFWHEKLSGCNWHIVGTLVPPTPIHMKPGYPRFKYGIPQPTELQAWLWRVYKLPSEPHPRHPPLSWYRPFGDQRWCPDKEVWVTMELRSSDGPNVARRVWEWVHFTQLASSGHPEGPHDYLNDSVLLEAVVKPYQRSAEGLAK